MRALARAPRSRLAALRRARTLRARRVSFHHNKHRPKLAMSSLSQKYEQAKRRRYGLRADPLGGSLDGPRARFVPRQRSSYRDVPRIDPSPIKEAKYPRDPPTTFSPIRPIPLSLAHQPPASILMTGSPPTAHVSAGRAGRVQKPPAPRRGVLERLSHFLNRAAKRDGKRVWFEDDELLRPPAAAPAAAPPPALEERHRIDRLKRLYEQELSRLEDELEMREREIEDARQALRQSDQRGKELEASFRETLDAERHASDSTRQRVAELEASLREQRLAMEEQARQVELAQQRVLEELREVDRRRQQCRQLDQKRAQVLDEIRRQRNKPAEASRALAEQQRRIERQRDDNDQQQLRFLETLVEMSRQLARTGDRLLLAELEALVSALRPRAAADASWALLRQRLDSYRELVALAPPRQRAQLRDLFGKLEHNLASLFAKREAAVKALDHEIFRVNLVLADRDAVARLLQLTTQSKECLRYLRHFEDRTRLLAEMAALTELRLQVSKLMRMAGEGADILDSSTPRPQRDPDFSLSPIDVSAYFRDIDRCAAQT